MRWAIYHCTTEPRSQFGIEAVMMYSDRPLYTERLSRLTRLLWFILQRSHQPNRTFTGLIQTFKATSRTTQSSWILSFSRQTYLALWKRTQMDGANAELPLLTIGSKMVLHRNKVNKSGFGEKLVQSDFRVGVYGWRKRCLYCFICALTVVVLLNLALTIWVMSVLDISSVSLAAN